MNFDVITLANMRSHLDSYGFDPSNQDLLVWNATNARYEPSPLKTVGGSSIIGTGDITMGSKGAVYSVDLSAPSNVTLASTQTTVDGVALTAGTTVLLSNQTNKVENGVYVSSGPGTILTRVPGVELASQYFFVSKGASLSNKLYYGSNSTPPSVGTDLINIDLLTPQETLVSGSNIGTIGGNSVLGSGNLSVTGSPVVDTATFTATASRPITLVNTVQPIFAESSTAYDASGGHHIGRYSVDNSAGNATYGTYTQASITAATGGNGTTGQGRIWVFWLWEHSSTPDNLIPYLICRVYKTSNGDMYTQVGAFAAGVLTWQTAIAITAGAGMTNVFDVKPVGGRQFMWVGSTSNAIGAAIANVWVGVFMFNSIFGVLRQGATVLSAAQTQSTGNLSGYYICDVCHYYGSSATGRAVLVTANQASATSWTLLDISSTAAITHLSNSTLGNCYTVNTTYDSFAACFEFMRINKDLGVFFWLTSGGGNIQYRFVDLSKIYSNSTPFGSVKTLTTYDAETISAFIPESYKRLSSPIFYLARSEISSTSNIGWVGAYKITIDSSNPTSSTISPLAEGFSNILIPTNPDLDTCSVKIWCQSPNQVKMYFRRQNGQSLVWSVEYNPTTAVFTNVGVMADNTWSFANDPYNRYNNTKGTIGNAEGQITVVGGISANPTAGSTYNQLITYSSSYVTYDLDRISGVTQVAISTGSNAVVTGKGGLIYDASYALVPGSKYYVNDQAQLSTTVNGTRAAYAVTKNHLYIYA